MTDRHCKNSEQTAALTAPGAGVFSRRKVALALALLWLPLVLFSLPGNLAWDSGTSIYQFLGLRYETPNNPVFQDFLMGMFYAMGRSFGNANTGITVYCVLQALLCILLLSRFISDLSRRSRGAAAVLTLFYGLMPMYPLYAFTMAKDSNFALAALMYVTSALEAVRGGAFWQDRRKVLRLCGSIVLMGLLRNLAGWVPAIAFALYALVSVRHRPVLLAALGTLAAVALTVVLPPALGAPKHETREAMSAPLQSMAYYALQHPDDITEEDQQTIGRVIDYATMLSEYDPNLADSIKNRATLDASTTGPFLRLWFSKFFRHPGTMLEGIWRSADKYFIPSATVTGGKPHAIIGYWISDYARDSLQLQNNNPNLGLLRLYISRWMAAPVLGLLVRIGLYTILTLVCAVLIAVFRRPRYYFCIAPLLMVLVGCILSPVNGYYRYAYPIILCLPVVLGDLWPALPARLRAFLEKRKNRPAPVAVKAAPEAADPQPAAAEAPAAEAAEPETNEPVSS